MVIVIRLSLESELGLGKVCCVLQSRVETTLRDVALLLFLRCGSSRGIDYDRGCFDISEELIQPNVLQAKLVQERKKRYWMRCSLRARVLGPWRPRPMNESCPLHHPATLTAPSLSLEH